MHSLQEKKTRRTFLWAGPAVLAVWALFSPVFGPVMDHHFPERHHSHAHIYFGPPDVDHIHPYQGRHAHGPVQSANVNKMNRSLPAENVPAGVVYLIPLDGMGQDSLAPLTPATQPLNSFPDQGELSLLSAWPLRYDPLQEAYVPLPKRPPRS